MITFLKANAASAIATTCDFLLATLLVSVMHISPVAGSVAGVIFGGIVHFSTCRYWVFNSTNERLNNQAGKYLLIWIGYILLHGVVMFLLVRSLPSHYLMLKAITTVVLFVCYNYPMHKNFVFKTRTALNER